ncbi:MAG: response regulator [Thermodesulfobacteriota bacterium]
MPERILIVDDEVDMLTLLRMIIRNNTDYEVETTNSPSEAIKLFKDKDFDLVITDLKMPGLDGLDIFEEFKGLKAHVPVIIITAYGSPETAEDALRLGVTEFITKPFRKDGILFAINRVLELARVRKENIELRRKLEQKDGG